MQPIAEPPLQPPDHASPITPAMAPLSRSEFLAAVRREPVEAGSPVIGGHAPFALDPPVELEALEGGVQRSFLHLEDVLGKLAKQLSDGVAVERPSSQRLEDHHVQRARQQIVLSHRLSADTDSLRRKFRPVQVDEISATPAPARNS